MSEELKNEENEPTAAPLVEHLAELRTRLIKSVIFFLVFVYVVLFIDLSGMRILINVWCSRFLLEWIGRIPSYLVWRPGLLGGGYYSVFATVPVVLLNVWYRAVWNDNWLHRRSVLCFDL